MLQHSATLSVFVLSPTIPAASVVISLVLCIFAERKFIADVVAAAAVAVAAVFTSLAAFKSAAAAVARVMDAAAAVSLAARKSTTAAVLLAFFTAFLVVSSLGAPDLTPAFAALAPIFTALAVGKDGELEQDEEDEKDEDGGDDEAEEGKDEEGRLEGLEEERFLDGLTWALASGVMPGRAMLQQRFC